MVNPNDRLKSCIFAWLGVNPDYTPGQGLLLNLLNSGGQLSSLATRFQCFHQLADLQKQKLDFSISKP